MISVLNAFNTQKASVRDSILELDEGDTDGIVDEQGRSIRWQRVFEPQEA